MNDYFGFSSNPDLDPGLWEAFRASVEEYKNALQDPDREDERYDLREYLAESALELIYGKDVWDKEL